jgi:hypothetical protein
MITGVEIKAETGNVTGTVGRITEKDPDNGQTEDENKEKGDNPN